MLELSCEAQRLLPFAALVTAPFAAVAKVLMFYLACRDPYLMGHWAPVHTEVLAQDLEVIEGELPADLNGAFVRTGPNPKLTPEGGYHLFDGDGMIHAVKIGGGKASYCNRWVETARLAQEEKAGWPVTVKSE
jgi:carotenoid cleavage dioxygenase